MVFQNSMESWASPPFFFNNLWLTDEGLSTLGRRSTSRGHAAHEMNRGRRAAPAVLLSTITYRPSPLNGRALGGSPAALVRIARRTREHPCLCHVRWRGEEPARCLDLGGTEPSSRGRPDVDIGSANHAGEPERIRDRPGWRRPPEASERERRPLSRRPSPSAFRRTPPRAWARHPPAAWPRPLRGSGEARRGRRLASAHRASPGRSRRTAPWPRRAR